tara:strand:- start:25 stop:816 length:792 start_codon:yes stop_codon:yes gene_type:complete
MSKKFFYYDRSILKYFNENGYVIIKNFFDKQSCDHFKKLISKYANEGFAPLMNPDRSEYLISQITDKIEKIDEIGKKANFVENIKKDTDYFRSIMNDKKILRLLSRLKKNKKIYPLMSQMIFKKANTIYSKQSWQPHQDNSYAKNKNGHYITINIFMDKSNLDNGTMYVWKKSHKYGIFKYQKKVSYREKDNKPGNITISNKKFELENLLFEKGDMLILHGNLVHGSYPNNSKKKSRSLYSVSYIPEKEKFISGKNAQRKIIH